MRFFAFCLFLAGLAPVSVLAFGDPLKVPSDEQFAKPSADDFKKIDDSMLELDVFYQRQEAWMVCATGSITKSNRRTMDGKSHWVNFFAAGDKQGTKRQRIETGDLDPNPRLEIALNGAFMVKGGDPEYFVDYISTENGRWAVDKLSGEGPFEVEPGRDRNEEQFYYHGGFDPMVNILQVAANGKIPGRPSQTFPSKRLQDVANVNDCFFARWVTPMPRTNNKVFFRSTAAFRQGFPVLIINELGKGSEEQFVPLYPLGSVEILWKKISAENTVPVKVVRRIAVNPKDPKSDIEDLHSEFSLKWFVGPDVPKEVFDKKSLGELSLITYFPE